MPKHLHAWNLTRRDQADAHARKHEKTPPELRPPFAAAGPRRGEVACPTQTLRVTGPRPKDPKLPPPTERVACAGTLEDAPLEQLVNLPPDPNRVEMRCSVCKAAWFREP